MTYRFKIDDVLDFLTAPDGDWDDELDAWVNVHVDGSTAVMTFNPTLGDDRKTPDTDLRERFRVTVERIDATETAKKIDLPQDVSEFVDEIGDRHLESCVAAGECPWCAVYFKYTTKETR